MDLKIGIIVSDHQIMFDPHTNIILKQHVDEFFPFLLEIGVQQLKYIENHICLFF